MTDLTKCLHSFITVLSSCSLNFMTDLSRCVYSYMIVLTRFVLFYIVFLSRCVLTFLTSSLRDFSFCDVFFEVSSFAEEPTENVSLFHVLPLLFCQRLSIIFVVFVLHFCFYPTHFLVHLVELYLFLPLLYLIID